MTLTDADEHSPMDGVVTKRGKPITPDELKRIIDETQEHPISLGEKWFVIPSHWWSKLLKAAQERSLDDIPAIDCTSISNSTQQGFFLKSNLVEAADFQLLPEKIFNRLREIYGLVNENRDYIQREVVEKTGSRVIEVYPRVLTVSLARDSLKIHTLIIAIDDNMETLKGRVLNELRVRDVPESNIRFYIEQDNVYELIEPTQQNVDAYFDTAQKVVVDIKEDDSWFIMQNKSITTFGNRHLSGSYGIPPYVQERGPNHTPGVCGLHNLGNTCFMASAIQCLSNVPALTEYFVSDRYNSDINAVNPLGTKGELAKAYGDLMKMMWSGSYNSVQPRKLKTTIGQYAPRFGGYSQQDSQELMAYLLDGLHEDLNRVKNKPYMEEEEDMSKYDEYEHAELAWMAYKSRNDSIIVDKFHGQLKSTLVCPVCSKVSIKFDPFCFLSVPLPNKDKLHKQIIILMREQKQSYSSSGQKSWAKFSMSVTQSTTLEEAKAIMRNTLNQDLNYVLFSVSSPSDDIKVIAPGETLIREDRPRELYATILDHPAESSKLLVVKNQSSTGRPTSVPMIYSALDASHFTRQFLLTRALTFTKTMFLESDKFTVWSEKNQNNDDSMSGCDTDLTDSFKLYVRKSDGNYQEVVEDGPLPLTNDNINVVVFKWNDGTKPFNNYKGSDVIERECGITVRKEIRLEECIDLFTKKEELEEEDSWYCPQCKKHQRASKKLELWKLPEILIVHLKRFQYSRWTREKLEQLVQIPVRNFELNSKLANSRHEHIKYDLIAVTHHMGGMGGGHYTATALNKSTKKWYDFNDSATSVATPPTDPLCSRSPYLLVFCQKNPTPDGAHADSNFEMETDQ
ncbi:unnamed protein product [Auanema sp. JU1783]|nr:unnamed protein product [Auanema sp. JU1783]